MFKNGDILHSKTNDLIVIFRSYRPEFGSENGVPEVLEGIKIAMLILECI